MRASHAHNAPGPPRAAGGRGGERRSRIRLPIAVKYGLVTGLLLIVFMAFLGITSFHLAMRTAEREINDKGIKLVVMAAAAIDDPFWAQDALGQGADLSRAQARLEGILRTFRDEPGAQGVKDVVVFEADRARYVVAASGSNRLDLAEVESPVASDDAARAGVSIRAGVLEREAVRSYEHPITLGGGTVGHVRLFLSAAPIAALRTDLVGAALGNTLVAVLVGILVAVLVGRVLTMPVRELRQDMATVALGNLQHVSRVASGDELEQLAVAFNRMTAHLAEAQEREAGRKALERELAIATQIQAALLPDTIPEIPGYQLFAHYSSAREVGGDYYDILPVGAGRHVLVVADVSGKGIPGSLVMTMTRSLVRMATRESAEPAAVLHKVNASLFADMTRGMFVTCVYVLFDAGTGGVTLARAGHNPAYLYRAALRQLESLQPPGIALGMVGAEGFDPALREASGQLAPGDFLVLYTDGIVEAMDAAGNEYTVERFCELLRAHAGTDASALGEAVLADVRAHANGAEPSDDITLVILKRT